jgi:competence protein ComFB
MARLKRVLEIRNAMEEIVDEWLDWVINQLDVCGCEKCRADIKALSLNRLPPRYYVSEDGKIYSRLEELKIQFRVDVIAALAAAAFIVRSNPRHNRESEVNEDEKTRF